MTTKVFRHSRRYFGNKKKQISSSSCIMTTEIIHTLHNRFPNGMFLDASFGEGGHCINLIKSSSNNRVIGLDCDHIISKRVSTYLKHKYRETNRFEFIHSKWSNMLTNITKKLPEISETVNLFDGILIETGHALIQEKIRHNGLVFDSKTSNIDMRYFTTKTKKKNQSLAVKDLLKHKNITIELLSNIISIFGDQNIEISRKIAQGIIESDEEMVNMQDIVCIIGKVLEKEQDIQYVNPMFLFNKKKASWIRNDHPVKKTLNALIKFINNSFIELLFALKQSELLLKENGILMIICYDHLESRVIAEFLKSRNLLISDYKNINYDNDTTFKISDDDTLFLKQRNERLGENNWHGIGVATFNDFNAVPFIQAHISEISSHPKGKYARLLVLQRTNIKSKENINDYIKNQDDKIEIQTLSHNNLTQVVNARNDLTKHLLSNPSHNSFVFEASISNKA